LGQEVHYSPEEDLAQIDAQLIGSAKTSIDFASYALTDRVIIAAVNQRRSSRDRDPDRA